MLNLYKNIKKKRKELGLTQTDLALALGYSDKSMISKIEKGYVDLSQSKILEFAKILRVSPSELMGWSENNTNYEPETIAAHHDSDEWTDEELDEIEKFKAYVKSKRDTKE